ncbi:MAG: PD-(D/E)XK nuclease family protein, partial [Treponema sp.]|nr:PD-(D/E)XK nuclease family protein [Treponema sp.]
IAEYTAQFSADPFTAENQFITGAGFSSLKNDGSRPAALYPVQKNGYQAWTGRRKKAADAADTAKAIDSLSHLIRTRFCHDSEKKQMSVSASSLEKYYQCPLSWLYERVLKIKDTDAADDLTPYTTRGTVYHAVLHNFLEELKGKNLEPPVRDGDELRLNGTYEKFLAKSMDEVFNTFPYIQDDEEPEMSSLTARFLRAQKGQYCISLYEFLVQFMACFTGYRIISTEAGYTPSSSGAYVLDGRVDCILESPSGEGVIVDFKTKSMPNPTDANETGDAEIANFQLPLYIRLVESGESAEGKKIHTTLYFSILDKKPKMFTGAIENKLNGKRYPQKDEDIIVRDDDRYRMIMDEFDEKAAQFAAETNNGRFLQFISDYHRCRSCGYRAICRTAYSICRENTRGDSGNGR